MPTESRRLFLKAASVTAAGVLAGSLVTAEDSAGEHPQHAQNAAARPKRAETLRSTRSGDWSDPATWGGRTPAAADIPLVAGGHRVKLDPKVAITAGVTVAPGALLEFAADASAALECTGNVIVEGTLRMRPVDASVVHALRFRGIDERKFCGGGMDPLDSDVGLWVVGAGAVDLRGAEKCAWTRLTGSASAGAARFDVRDAAGWRVGDTVVIVPTDVPTDDGGDWDDRSNQPLDPFEAKFERRGITAIDGNTISLDAPLVHDHLAVDTGTGKVWTGEVANLTRNVLIEGARGGRGHVFIRSSVPQHLAFVEGRHLGPRNVQAGGGDRPRLVQGRYGLHFHHCMDGSRGSVVEGCALYDLGNRAYVPHMSHGVTMRHNVSFATMEAGFWWDFQEISHDVTWEGNLVALVRGNGIDSSTVGMVLNQGDGNVARDNVVVYGHHGDPHGHGGYVWDADSEGVWVFENNLSHSNRTGLFVWQNTSLNHTVVNHESYNDYLAVFHGAYVNSYTYTGGYVYNGIVRVKATSGNSSGVRFERMTFDGAGRTPQCVEVYPSPVPSGDDANAFRDCTFKNAPVAVLMNTFPIGNEETRKHVDLIRCAFENIKRSAAFTPESTPDSLFRIQTPDGRATRIVHASGESEIEPFAPTLYGNGTGLTGRYFNGVNFDRLAFSRVDSMIMFQQWSYDRAASPTGVHHLITGDAYSIRWTGSIQPQYTAPHSFRVQGGAGFRLWLAGRLIIDSWSERADNTDALESAPVPLEADRRYELRLETFNTAGARGCQLHWSCPQIGRMVHVPQSQLYPA